MRKPSKAKTDKALPHECAGEGQCCMSSYSVGGHHDSRQRLLPLRPIEQALGVGFTLEADTAMADRPAVLVEVL